LSHRIQVVWQLAVGNMVVAASDPGRSLGRDSAAQYIFLRASDHEAVERQRQLQRPVGRLGVMPTMPFFAMQYRVLFHDTMAYGSHHHMTNFKFQNVARETLLFEEPTDGPSWQEQLKDIVMLTREAYSLNLAPVSLGAKVAVLMTYEDPTRSSV